jgi:hypothetical protein
MAGGKKSNESDQKTEAIVHEKAHEKVHETNVTRKQAALPRWDSG